MPPRRSRGSSRAVARAAARTPTPATQPSEPDENIQDNADTPQEPAAEELEAANDNGSDAQISDDVAYVSPRTSRSARGRGSNRSLRTRAAAAETLQSTPDPVIPDEVSESGFTPRGRRRGRPVTSGRGGFRGRGRRGGMRLEQATRVTDKEGNTLDVINDEVAVPDNPEGETKVNKDGELQGGREYRVRVFPIKTRGNRLYMLSTEPARCTGYRDSYLFFTKHPHLFKIIIGDEEKRDLIDRDVLPHSYKGRAIGVVTARSVFREFGAKIVVAGRKVIDDYKADEARARGDVEGELADPHDRLPPEGQPYNRNQFVAWHGASSVYHSNMPNMPAQGARPAGAGKRKAAITSANWMLEHAREAARFNGALAAARRPTLQGVYDPHTNLTCYPRHMQPTHAKWEPVEQRMPPSTKGPHDAMANGTPAPLVNGISHGHGHGHGHEPQTEPDEDHLNRLQPPSQLTARNYLVADTYYVTPPDASLPCPGPSNNTSEMQTPLDGRPPDGGLPDLDDEDLALLPEGARAAYLRAKGVEGAWRGMWGCEGTDGMRASLRIGVGVL